MKVILKRMKKNKKIKVFFVVFAVFATLIYFTGKHLYQKHKIDKKYEVDVYESSKNENYRYLIDFESSDYLKTTDELTKEKSLSGYYSSKINIHSNFSSTIEIPVPTNDREKLTETNIKFWLNPTTKNIKASFVLSIFDSENNQIHWDAYKIEKKQLTPDIWYAFKHKFKIPSAYVDKRNTIRLYLWSHDNNKYPVHMDDVVILFNEKLTYEKPRTILIDFEEISDNRISSKYAKEGFYSTFANGEDSFSASSTIPFSDIKTDNIQSIAYRFHFLSEAKFTDAVFVAEIIDEEGNNLLWHGTHINKEDFEVKEWEIFNGEIVINEKLAKPENSLKFYLWNRYKSTVYLDNIYVVIKETGYLDPDERAICDFTKNPEFVPKKNHPPYKFKNLYKQTIKSKINLSSIFLKNDNLLAGNFDEDYNTDQILLIRNNSHKIVYFENIVVTDKPVSFNPKLPKKYNIFECKGKVYVYDKSKRKIIGYQLDSKSYRFNSFAKSESLNISDNIIEVFTIGNNIISAIGSKGYTYNLKIHNEKLQLESIQKLVNPNNTNINIKAFKGIFFYKQSRELLMIYLQESKSKYEFFTYNQNNHLWKPSPNHTNKSIESFDKLDYFNTFWVGNFYQDQKDQMLMLNLSERFDLKMLEFNKLSYNIRFNIDFKGFTGNQNPKFYEIRHILCGNFIDNNKTDILIFQDNHKTVSGFNQKTEIYSFK